MDEYDENLRRKLDAEYKKKHQNARVIKQQLFDFKVNKIKQIKEEKLEGELIKRKALEDQEQARREEMERKMKQATMREDLMKANEELKEQVEEQKRKERAQEKAVVVPLPPLPTRSNNGADNESVFDASL